MNARDQAMAHVSDLWAEIDVLEDAKAKAHEMWFQVPKTFPPTIEQRQLAEEFESAIALCEIELDEITAEIARIRWEARL